MTKLSLPQSRLLARIGRCDKTGYKLTRAEERTAAILKREGLIAVSSMGVAWTVEVKP